MISYQTALKHHTMITKPPRSKYWRETLPDDARPIKSVGTRNKSIHKTDKGVVYYRLYRTNLVTFIPNALADNTYTTVIRMFNSVTTTRFMGENGLHYRYQYKTDPATGIKDVLAQIPYIHCGYNDFASAILTFDSKTDQLLVDPELSWHPTIHTRVLSEGNKAERAKLLEKLSTLKTLSLFTVDNLLPEAMSNATMDLAQPFYDMSYVGRNRPMYALWEFSSYVSHTTRDMLRLGTHLDHFDFDNPEFIERYQAAVPSMLTRYLSIKASALQIVERGMGWHDAVKAAANQLDISDLEKSIERQLFRSFGKDKGDAHKEKPLFLKRLPSKFYIDNWTCPYKFVNKLSNLVPSAY